MKEISGIYKKFLQGTLLLFQAFADPKIRHVKATKQMKFQNDKELSQNVKQSMKKLRNATLSTASLVSTLTLFLTGP